MRVYTRCAELRQPFSPPLGIARLASQASLARTQCVFFWHNNYDLSWFTLTEVVATSWCGLLHLVSTCTVGVRKVYKPDHHTISLRAFHSNLWLLLGFFYCRPCNNKMSSPDSAVAPDDVPSTPGDAAEHTPGIKSTPTQTGKKGKSLKQYRLIENQKEQVLDFLKRISFFSTRGKMDTRILHWNIGHGRSLQQPLACRMLMSRAGWSRWGACLVGQRRM